MKQAKQLHTFFIESLGCAKNTVDSHAMAAVLTRAGLQPITDAEQADVIIVNTCGFIRPAQDESIQVLNGYIQGKKKEQYVIAAGCLSEGERGNLLERLPGLDAALSTRRWADILQVIKHLQLHHDSPYLHFPATESFTATVDGIPAVAIQGKSAYLKIADGCDRHCAFCLIPRIKGPMVSRKREDILYDAQYLQQQGVKEIILIAQDSTAYGRDLGLDDGLPALLLDLVQTIPDVPWVRIMYTFPGSISDSLIAVMQDEKKILPYLDIPLQHAHPSVLKRMHRPSNMTHVRKTLEKMRKEIPDLAFRSTFIVGFPGETDEEFSALSAFVEEIQFDHVGIFPYYHEEGTLSFALKDNVSDAIKNERIHALARLQEDISLNKNKTWVGRTIDVLVEGNGDGISIGRSFRDAPEIDGLVFLDSLIEPGKMVHTQVTGAMVHDLMATAE